MNELTWAVAGSGKTQSIADLCASLTPAAARRTLALTYTQTGQRELAERLRRVAPRGPGPKVMGWYSFLLTHFARPYLPRLLPGRRLRGFDFHGDPGRYAKGAARYLDTESRAYRLHLAKLACQVSAASDGAPVDRLSRMYDTIFIDEVQDLVGWDLEVLDQLLNSRSTCAWSVTSASRFSRSTHVTPRTSSTGVLRCSTGSGPAKNRITSRAPTSRRHGGRTRRCEFRRLHLRCGVGLPPDGLQ